jgi:hypothetical protein
MLGGVGGAGVSPAPTRFGGLGRITGQPAAALLRGGFRAFGLREGVVLLCSREGLCGCERMSCLSAWVSCPPWLAGQRLGWQLCLPSRAARGELRAGWRGLRRGGRPTDGDLVGGRGWRLIGAGSGARRSCLAVGLWRGAEASVVEACRCGRRAVGVGRPAARSRGCEARIPEFVWLRGIQRRVACLWEAGARTVGQLAGISPRETPRLGRLRAGRRVWTGGRLALFSPARAAPGPH